jgi:lysophospholipase L1-like esterase
MKLKLLFVALSLCLCRPAMAGVVETKPNDPYFARLYVVAAPKPKGPALQKGSRLAICGDSITEQKMYSRIMETYITVALPELGVTTRQFGWSGEQAAGFLARMTNDVLRFNPTVATTCYGMNDHHYRPYEPEIGMAYASNMTDVILAFKSAGTRVIVGSPGCMGPKTPPWGGAAGTAEDRNVNLCTLRNIDIEIADFEQVGFADVFWPMYKAQFQAAQRWGTNYALAGKDSVHPGWAGHLVMAYAFLKALDVPGDIGTFNVDLKSGNAVVSAGHQLIFCKDGVVSIKSSRYPFCAADAMDNDDSIRSGMSLVPFNQELNRLILIARNGKAKRYKVTWGAAARDYTDSQLKQGVNLAEDFPVNPFSDAFKDVDEAVSTKQIYETKQIKELFHGQAGKADAEKTAADSEQVRAALVEAVKIAFVPVTHTITIKPEM